MNNSQYRSYMTNQASNIMKKNMLEVSKEQGVYPTIFNYRIGTPYLYRTCRETTTPVGYENSDLKKDYLFKMRNSSI